MSEASNPRTLGIAEFFVASLQPESATMKLETPDAVYRRCERNRSCEQI